MASFSSVKIEGSRATGDRVYYNGTIINNSKDTDQLSDDPAIKYYDQRESDLIKDASSYEIAVENFSLNGGTKNLPVFIPVIADPSTNVDLTVYTISFCVYNGLSYYVATEPIIWQPENQAPYTIKPDVGPVQLETDYYYCYDYTHWVSLVNVALKTAWEAATALAATNGEVFGTKCPWFEYDANTGLFSLNQDSKTCMVPTETPLPVPYSVTYTAVGDYRVGEYSFVGINTNLENLFTNFNTNYYGPNQEWVNSGGQTLPEIVIDFGLSEQLVATQTENNTPIGKSLRSLPKSSFFQLVNPFTGSAISDATFVRLQQDFTSTGTLWSPIASIVLTTSEIRVRNEFSSNPIAFATANIGDQRSSSGSSNSILIETPIDALKADLWKGFVLYEPKVPRFSSLDPSASSISTIDVNMYWRNRLTNALIPLRLPNGGSASFRLLFKRKINCVRSA
jgi:hypothetical protein